VLFSQRPYKELPRGYAPEFSVKVGIPYSPGKVAVPTHQIRWPVTDYQSILSTTLITENVDLNILRIASSSDSCSNSCHISFDSGGIQLTPRHWDVEIMIPDTATTYIT